MEITYSNQRCYRILFFCFSEISKYCKINYIVVEIQLLVLTKFYKRGTIDQGGLGQTDAATKHAEAAVEHLKASKKK